MRDLFENGPTRSVPGVEDFDQHYTTGQQWGYVPRYELNDDTGEIDVYDPAWGEEHIGDWEGDEIFAELFRHPVFQRLAAIEQLTLPKIYSTMPGSTEFTRWEHAWGSVVFVRKMIREAEAEGRTFTPREKLVLQLRTFVSDAAHTAFSHLGDWLRQGFGGSEDSHDEDLTQYLEDTGVNEILRRSQFQIQPEEVVFPPIHDWVECPSPALCVDRVDYGVREIMRWVDPAAGRVLRHAFKLDDQNRLVMKSKEAAKYFGVCFGMLATEHWSHPVHRLQLQLFGDIVKGAILNGPPMLRGEGVMHPVDMLYTVDNDVIANIRTIGTLNNDLHALLLDIARAQRRVFAWGRQPTIEDITSNLRPSSFEKVRETVRFPHPLHEDSFFAEYAGVAPQNIELLPVGSQQDVPDFNQLPHTYDIYLPAFKPRAIDPQYTDADGQTRHISETDAHYKTMLSDVRAIQGQPYVARIYMAPQAKEKLQTKMSQVQKAWNKAMARERTQESRTALNDALRIIGHLAISTSPNRINLVFDARPVPAQRSPQAG